MVATCLLVSRRRGCRLADVVARSEVAGTASSVTAKSARLGDSSVAECARYDGLGEMSW